MRVNHRPAKWQNEVIEDSNFEQKPCKAVSRWAANGGNLHRAPPSCVLKTLIEVWDEIVQDMTLVLWDWNPGEGRTLIPIPQIGLFRDSCSMPFLKNEADQTLVAKIDRLERQSDRCRDELVLLRKPWNLAMASRDSQRKYASRRTSSAA
jgi:hypothetical protein